MIPKKNIDDLISDFPPAGRPAEKIQNFPKSKFLRFITVTTTTTTTPTAGL